MPLKILSNIVSLPGGPGGPGAPETMAIKYQQLIYKLFSTSDITLN